MSLIGSNSRSNASVTNLALLGTKNGELKIKEPEPFNGDPEQEDKVLWVANYLRDGARKWLEPHLDDFLDYPNKNDRKLRTNELFGNVRILLKDIEKLYGSVDELKKAERQMHSLR
ncbi:hypothetical protein PMZ80_010892 [Knufia obscura]|uniref:Uncharacterized protein n=1 Tax=Knufia obscura TaxID=1635080 RepID=A0ABR0R988_9EURO|nr:hypothetical protein PMZ80_010892 [Knufia obscura]